MVGMRQRVLAVLIAGFVFFSLAPTIYELANRDRVLPERTFELIHNFYTDYNFYLSRIRQGLEGHLLVREKYTSEPHAGSLIHSFYALMGLLGSWVKVPWGRPGDVYQVSRVVLGALLLAMIAEFIKKSFSFHTRPRSSPLQLPVSTIFWPLLAFLLAVTASSWPIPVNWQGSWRFGGYMSWWSVMDNLQRITFIPHILAGQVLIVFWLMALTDSRVLQRPSNWFFLGVLGFSLGIIFPPGLTFLLVGIGVVVVGELVFTKVGWRVWAKWGVWPRLVVILLSFPSLIYLALMLSFYPWRRLAEFDVLHPLPFNYLEYAKAVGPVLPLGIAGMIVAAAKREAKMLPSVAWVVTWLLLLVIFRFIPQQNPLRFSEVLPHVPLSVLTAYLFSELYRRSQVTRRFGRLAARLLLLIVPFGLVATGFGMMYSSWLWQKDFIDHKLRATIPLVPTGAYVMYPLRDFVAAIQFIQDKTGQQEIILSETTAGNYIPPYAGRTVYVGHDNTVYAEAKKELVKRFFSGKMTHEEAYAWLAAARLTVVFFGPQEKKVGGIKDLPMVYPFLGQIFQNTNVTIYRVQ